MLGKMRGRDGEVIDLDAAVARKQAKDNERIAAAAPELLAALKGLCSALIDVSELPFEIENKAHAARVLIARLEGK